MVKYFVKINYLPLASPNIAITASSKAVSQLDAVQ
jgi:hypothetical protein